MLATVGSPTCLANPDEKKDFNSEVTAKAWPSQLTPDLENQTSRFVSQNGFD